MTQSPLFTAIVHTYNRPRLLKRAVKALQMQTYDQLEIILINNGATPETVEYLHEVALADQRVKLIHFEDNQFSWNDPVMYLDICCNAALAQATGEYVWLQQDDDFLAHDYVEKMVALFRGNPECTTAAGLAVSVDIEGTIDEHLYKVVQNRNRRPKYTSGREVALDQIEGSRTMFSAPGEIFTIKRDVLLQAGGYHRAFESSQIYGILPFGITGFDSEALFHWTHHDGQLNRKLTQNGWIGIDEALGLLEDWKIEQRWSVFGANLATRVVRAYKEGIYNRAARSFVVHLYNFRPKPAFIIMLKVWAHPHFWKRVATFAIDRKFYGHAIGPMVKPVLKSVFRICPSLAKLTPLANRLNEKVNRWK